MSPSCPASFSSFWQEYQLYTRIPEKQEEENRHEEGPETERTIPVSDCLKVGPGVKVRIEQNLLFFQSRRRSSFFFFVSRIPFCLCFPVTAEPRFMMNCPTVGQTILTPCPGRGEESLLSLMIHSPCQLIQLIMKPGKTEGGITHIYQAVKSNAFLARTHDRELEAHARHATGTGMPCRCVKCVFGFQVSCFVWRLI